MIAEVLKLPSSCRGEKTFAPTVSRLTKVNGDLASDQSLTSIRFNVPNFMVSVQGVGKNSVFREELGGITKTLAASSLGTPGFANVNPPP